jgi:hypothetical protein
MNSLRALPAVVIAARIVISSCGSSSQTTSTATTSVSSPADGSNGQVGPAGGSPTGRTMSAASTATLAQALGVTPAKLTAAITTARANGAGVNLVKTLSTELNVSETKVAAGLKALGPNGP